MQNSSRLCWKMDLSFESISSAILALLNIISGVLAVSSNLLVLTAISKFSALRTVSNFFIASLAVADISVGVLMNPVYASIFIVNATENNHPLRVTEHWLWLQTTVVSTFTLTAVSIERHIAVTKCFRYTEIVTLNRCIYGIASIWIFSILYASQRFLFHGDEDLPSLWICTTILTVFLPFFVISYCYVYIFKAARSQCIRIAADNSLCKEVLKNKKAACTLCIVIGLFALLWLPSLALSLWHISVADPLERQCIDYLWFWAAFLSFTSSFFNPWIYTIRTKEFRMAFLKVLRVKSKSWEMDICGLQFKWSRWRWISKHVYCPVLERKTYSLSMQKKVRFTDPFGVMMKLQKFVNT